MAGEDKILRMLTEIQTDIKILKENDITLKEDIESLKKSVAVIEFGHGELRTDIKILKENDIALKEDIESLKKSVAVIEFGHGELRTDIKFLKENGITLKEDIESLKKSVTVIEFGHGDKLAWLLDGYKTLYDISTDIRSEMAALKGRQEKHGMQINILETDKKKNA
ncbi:MAG: hypothetical protein LBS19_13710 [Clostridiales bacterium]|jgi:S-adenosylhomocysteine hydrolase|nr:hypothetical protein [Clostridiales bacterium]